MAVKDSSRKKKDKSEVKASKKKTAPKKKRIQTSEGWQRSQAKKK